ncbi:MAG: glycoside hydrolase family 28 protein [Phycisphaerae bacterium]
MSTQTTSIADTGAQPGRLCTEEIQKAIDLAADAGGIAYVPPGEWISGTLRLHSGVTLHLHPAAVLKASGDIKDFPAMQRRGTAMTDQAHHFIVAEDAEDVVITGGGTLDGNGFAFWNEPEAGRKWYRAKKPRVHPMLEFRRCRRLRLENVRIANSPGWTVHPYCCDEVTLRGVTVENYLFGPNTDGFDINGCRDVFVSDCKLTCGDDPIVIKATKDARSSERILINNCVVRTQCIGVQLGQETESDIRQVTVSNCVMHDCDRMFGIGIWAGGTVEDVTVTNCTGSTPDDMPLARPIHIEVKQHVGWDVPLGKIRNVQISNFVARTKGRLILVAQDGTALENVSLRDVQLRYTGLADADKLSPPDGATGSTQYANQNLQARRQNAAVVVENAENFRLEGLHITWPDEPELPYAVVWARHVHGGVIDAPLASPTGGQEQAMLLDDVDVEFRGG